MVMLNNNFKQNFSNLQNKEQASLKNHNDTKQDFNIFTILRKTGEEVGLHSRFLAELLNRNASHKIADFQQLFIETVLNNAIATQEWNREKLSEPPRLCRSLVYLSQAAIPDRIKLS